MNWNLILPCAGRAERMGGIPKFLLPISSQRETLLGRWIIGGNRLVDSITICTSNILVELVNSIYNDVEKVSVESVSSKSMPETVGSVLREGGNLVVMPDTFVSDPADLIESLISHVQSFPKSVGLATWSMKPENRGRFGQVATSNGKVFEIIDKDPDCDLPHFWGAIAFEKDSMKINATIDSHFGTTLNRNIKEGVEVFEVYQKSNYVDCGVFQDYLDLLKAHND